jgi:sigma-E factor negative regulatory protein RseB
VVVALGLLTVDVDTAAGAPPSSPGEAFERAARSAQEVPHRGELLCVVWSQGRSAATTVDVANHGSGRDVHAAQGLELEVPGDGAARGLDRKYRLTVAGGERLLGRPATRVEVRARRDGDLRERLWVDDETGLMLRRERYLDGRRRALFVYLSLDVGGDVRGGGARPAPRAVAARTTRAPGAGWPGPSELPGGYRSVQPPVRSGPDGEALHVVYSDGLYSVSLFSQPGSLDGDALPAGARATRDGAYEWPGAVPQRRVWEASGATWTLVGDAPPREFRAIAAALPQPEPASPLRRLERGFTRLRSWLLPWT